MKSHGSGEFGVRLSQTCVFVTLCVMSLVLAGCPPEVVTIITNSTSPGIHVSVLDVEIPLDNRAVISLTITDDAGDPIPLRELTDIRFILAHLDESPPSGSTAQFASYITRLAGGALQATYDGARLAGLAQAEDGSYTYTFATAIPGGYSMTATHQVGGQAGRLFPINGESYSTNMTYSFRPDGGDVTKERDIVQTETCNVCHTTLSAHGSRREVQLCILCHNPGSTDPDSGNSVDFPEMIHKIHRGADLPSVKDGEPYQIIGYQGSVHDYSTVHFPQPVSNCSACHDSDDKRISNENVSLDWPTLQGCASCHDRTWFGHENATPTDFENHVGGQQVDDSLCSLCHTPTAPGPSPIMEAHLQPTQTEVAPGLAFTITGITAEPLDSKDILSEQEVTIEFTAEDYDGNLFTDLSIFSTLAITMAYPVSEYEEAYRENIDKGQTIDKGNGNFSHTFTTTVPGGSTDTFAVAMEGRFDFDFQDGSERQGTTDTGRAIFTLDGSDPVERRQIISDSKCNACHEDLRLHGSLRVGVDYCVMCHNPNATDIGKRSEEQMPPESVNFKDMIHKIHTGEDLNQPFVVAGFSSLIDFSHIRFPGDRSKCEICHEEDTYELPLPEEALSTVVLDDNEELVIEKLPVRATCTSCHDALITEIHSILATDDVSRVESCAVCHGSDADFSVLDVHGLNN